MLDFKDVIKKLPEHEVYEIITYNVSEMDKIKLELYASLMSLTKDIGAALTAEQLSALFQCVHKAVADSVQLGITIDRMAREALCEVQGCEDGGLSGSKGRKGGGRND